MKLVSEAEAEVVNLKAEEEDNAAEEADAAKEEYMTAVVDAETDIPEAVGIIQVKDGAYRMQEWYSTMMANR